MKYRRFGRTNWNISEVGYGMWGMGEWSESDDKQSSNSLDIAVDGGVNFFDTAWAYGRGHSERLLGNLVKRHSNKKLYLASKVPPKNFTWPSKKIYSYFDCYPIEHINNYVDKTLKNLNLDHIDLIQLHTWDDSWADIDEWKKSIEELKKSGKISAFGLSLNRWEPDNGIKALRYGLIDSVQVIYNIFDQSPEDNLFPSCKKYDVGIIARVPFDEGTLTGNITKETKFPKEDWRSTYFVPENLISSVEKVDMIRPLIPSGISMAEVALKFILMNNNVGTVIPGMRKKNHVESNISVSDSEQLEINLYKELRKHRWDRLPTSWSQ